MLLRQLRLAIDAAQERADSLVGDVQTARAEVQELRAREVDLTRMALDAQRTFDEMRRRAEIEALQLERDAETRAREIIAGAQARARTITTVAEEAAADLRAEIARRTNEASAEVEELLKLRARLRAETAGSPAVALPPTPAPTPEVAESGRRGSVFDTFVEVEAGPFVDFAALSAFERALGRGEKVNDVYIRRFAQERATIEVTLSEPAPLLDGLQGVLPNAFDVIEEDPSWLKLEVTTPLAGVW
jgi:hypothetical protein